MSHFTIGVIIVLIALAANATHKFTQKYPDMMGLWIRSSIEMIDQSEASGITFANCGKRLMASQAIPRTFARTLSNQ